MLFPTLFAEFFEWILLIGIILLPGSFTTADDGSQVRNPPLLGVGFSLIGLGALGMYLVWRSKRKDVDWLLQCLFIPAVTHGFAGFTVTLVNIYFNDNSIFTGPSIAALAVACTYTAIAISLTLYYWIYCRAEDTTATLLSRFFNWVLLQGFLLLAGSSSHVARVESLLQEVRNPPLLGVAFGCVGVGAIALCLIWWYQARQRKYVWLHQSLFIPGISTGFAGLTSTLVNLFSNDNGSLGASTTATLTSVIVCIVICIVFAIYYRFRKNPSDGETGGEAGAPAKDEPSST